MRPTLHLVALPHTQTTARYLSCAYTQKVVKFCRMMRDGWRVILYAGEENEAPCDEHVELVSEAERHGWFGNGFDTVRTPLSWEASEPYWQTANTRASSAIRERMSERDLLLLIAGTAQQPIADAVPLQALEWGVGYLGTFARFCAFESSAWRHHVYGRRSWDLGHFYDAVIPNFFDPADFELEAKDDYLLFVGRLIHRKGPHVALDIATRAGMPLVYAGPGAVQIRPNLIRTDDGLELAGDVQYVGEVGLAERASLMARARALIAPTLYLEPFGGVAVEAMFAGTPALTTDFGAFPETVEPGVTGERFCTLADADQALERVLQLEPAAIRARAVKRFSLEAVRPLYERWFDQILGLWGQGWYA